MPKLKNLVGLRFGRLLVLEIDGMTPHGNYRWRCQCDCGAQTTVPGGWLTGGATRSCGCFASDLISSRNTTHGLPHLPTYRIWASMVQRCTNPKSQFYANYGGRGVLVHPPWLLFANFLADMGERPIGLSLDRYPDNDGGYEPKNCRWATTHQQARNKRSTRFLESGGLRLSLAEWAEQHNISASTLWSRLKRGWSLEKALSVPCPPKRRPLEVA